MSDASFQAAVTVRPRRRWLQFGLRTMFAIVTLAGGVSYLLIRPTILANEFCSAIAAEVYSRAESYLTIEGPSSRIFPPDDRIKVATAELSPFRGYSLLDRRRWVRMLVAENNGGWENVTVIFNWWGGKVMVRMT